MDNAISLNGNAVSTLNGLYETVKPGFESLLSNSQGLGDKITPSSMEGLLEKFNEGMDTLGLEKYVFQGDLPDVMENFSDLTKTFFEHVSDAAEQTADISEDMVPSAAPSMSE